MSEENNYWIVGANWSGDDQVGDFFKLGFWELGYALDEKPQYEKRFLRVKKDDRIAIKSMMGQGQETIRIKGLGIVKEIRP